MIISDDIYVLLNIYADWNILHASFFYYTTS